jgi:hypothetical protein
MAFWLSAEKAAKESREQSVCVLLVVKPFDTGEARQVEDENQ